MNTMCHNVAQRNKKYYEVLFIHTSSSRFRHGKKAALPSSTKLVTKIDNPSSFIANDFLGDHEQMRAAPALQLIPRLRDQHVFTILRQHGRAAIVVPGQ